MFLWKRGTTDSFEPFMIVFYSILEISVINNSKKLTYFNNYIKNN